jgi:hypothetical protein
MVDVSFFTYTWRSVSFVDVGGMDAEDANTNTRAKPETKIYYRSGDKKSELILSEGRRSKPQQYTGPLPLVFFLEKLSAQGEVTEVPVASLEFDATWKDLAIIVEPKPSSSKKVSMFPVPVDAFRLPKGNVLLYNMGTKSIMIDAEGERIPLRPYQSHKFSVARLNREPVVMRAAAVNDEGKFQIIYSARNRFREDARMILFFYPLGDEGEMWKSQSFPL